MTPRKELYIACKEELKAINAIEMVDLYRNQFGGGKSGFPDEFTAALIRINSIRWETMVEQRQEGEATIDILFYCKDGWLDQFDGTGDDDHGLIEIDVIDEIAEKLQFLYGNRFQPLQQTDDETEDQDLIGMMSYRLTFTTKVHRILKPKYTKQSINVTPRIDVSN